MPVAPVYVDGQKTVTLKGAFIAEEFEELRFVPCAREGTAARPSLKGDRSISAQLSNPLLVHPQASRFSVPTETHPWGVCDSLKPA